MAEAGEENGEAAAPGEGLVSSSLVATGVLVGTSAAAALAPTAFGTMHAVVSGALFAVGGVAFLWAYAIGVSRSRVDVVSVPGLFFLTADTAPPNVRHRLRSAVAVEVVAVVASAAVRPYSVVAFGILAPMFGIGVMGMWGARYGSFPRRPPGVTKAD